MTLNLVKKASTIFWDFDGVIKDSVSVKSDAFELLFLPFGDKVAKKVKKHHEENGGMSRYDKLPIYLNWAGENSSKELICKFEQKFSQLVKKQVIKSPWVVGVLEYLQIYYKKQFFFVVTATPQKEIEDILEQLQIACYFKQVIGSPTKKNEALKMLLNKYCIDSRQAIMIGDSDSDYEAAKVNKVKFILRKTELNKTLQKQLINKTITDFSNG